MCITSVIVWWPASHLTHSHNPELDEWLESGWMATLVKPRDINMELERNRIDLPKIIMTQYPPNPGNAFKDTKTNWEAVQ